MPAAKKGDSDTEETKEKYDFAKRTRMKLDRQAEWRQIFNESWRMVKYNFYDPKLHGVDWDGVKEYYGSLLPYVQTRGELNTLLNEMVGELNASHQGASGGDEIGSPVASMAHLGARLELDEKTGYPRFVRIYHGDKASLSNTEHSPLENDYVKVKEGDYLLAIDGQELQPFENFYQYLVDKTANKITIKTNAKPEMKGAIETTFMPLFYDAKLQYGDWAYSNEKFVDEKSGGRIGYMHLADMQTAGWASSARSSKSTVTRMRSSSTSGTTAAGASTSGSSTISSAGHTTSSRRATSLRSRVRPRCSWGTSSCSSTSTRTRTPRSSRAR